MCAKFHENNARLESVTFKTQELSLAGQLQEWTTSPVLLICAALVLPPRCDTSEGPVSIPQKQKKRNRRSRTNTGGGGGVVI